MPQGQHMHPDAVYDVALTQNPAYDKVQYDEEQNPVHIYEIPN